MEHYDRRRRALLLVEDNPADVFFLKQALRDEGTLVDVKVIDRGDRAHAHLVAAGIVGDHPSALLLDLGLPGVDGKRLIAELSKDSRLRHIPLLVWTSSDDPDLEDDLRRLGVYDFLRKPLDLDGYRDVARIVVKAMDERGSPSGDPRAELDPI